jgi:beta-lactamase class A
MQRFEHGCIAPDGSGAWDAFEACDPPPDLTGVLERVGRTVHERSSGTDATLGVSWLPSKQRWTHRGDEPRAAGSALKWLWASAALTKSTIEAVEPFAVRALGHSDNQAGAKMIDLAGGADGINEFTKALGIAPEAMSLCAFHADRVRRATSCYDKYGFENFFTANSALTFLEQLWRGSFVSAAARTMLLEWSKLGPVGRFTIGRQLPEAARTSMHQKRGELPPGCCGEGPRYTWTTAIAIIHTPRGPYAAFFSLAHGDYYPNQLTMIEWSSCIVYHAVARDIDDPFAAGCKLPTDGVSK